MGQPIQSNKLKGKQQQRLIIISATNLTEAGPLSVLKDCLTHASSRLSGRFMILALVHDRNLLGEMPGVEFMEFPLAKKTWFIRLFHEWFVFNRLSLKLKPFLWFSLHDMTPRVQAQRRAVYCHNPAMFYPLTFSEALREPVFAMFNKFYPLAYRINIAQNDWVIVQQEWMRKEFRARYPVRNIIVGYPSLTAMEDTRSRTSSSPGNRIFFFPAYPRFFKNIEVIGDAARILMARGRTGFEVRVTFDGSENSYARKMARQYRDVPALRFIGLQSRQRIFELYQETDCLIFPSRLETWGLPLSEFKLFGKPILAADLPYAHETVGHYDRVKFFNPVEATELASRMEEFLDGKLRYDHNEIEMPPAPFAANWDELLDILVSGKERAT